MKVYLACAGERGEGYTILGVFFSKEDAIGECLAKECHFVGGWELASEDYWSNGCDFVRVIEQEVK